MKDYKAEIENELDDYCPSSINQVKDNCPDCFRCEREYLFNKLIEARQEIDEKDKVIEELKDELNFGEYVLKITDDFPM